MSRLSMYDPLPRITKYILDCTSNQLGIEEKVLKEELDRFMLLGLSNNIRIIKKLQEIRDQLKEYGSIRYLLYEAVIQRIEKLKIPIYTIDQIDKIPNIPSIIKEQIQDVLNE